MMSLLQKVQILNRQRNQLMGTRLIPAARAAKNQMIDAGMKEGAAVLASVLFEIDSIDQEIEKICKTDPNQFAEELMKALLEEAERNDKSST